MGDYRERVPIRTYEEFWDNYWRDSFPRLVDCTWRGTIPYFALSSGTTRGATKYIPVSREINRANARAVADLLVHHVENRPDSRVLAGRCFMLGGSTGLTRQERGVYSGDLSGIAAAVRPAWTGPRYFPPGRLEGIADWETKVSGSIIVVYIMFETYNQRLPNVGNFVARRCLCLCRQGIFICFKKINTCIKSRCVQDIQTLCRDYSTIAVKYQFVLSADAIEISDRCLGLSNPFL